MIAAVADLLLQHGNFWKIGRCKLFETSETKDLSAGSAHDRTAYYALGA